MNSFLKLDNRVIIKLKIIPVSPLLILDGREREKEKAKEGKNNRCLFLRDNNGQIYIPGSTLKGVFRNKFIDIYEDEKNEYIGKLFGQKEEKGICGIRAKIFFQDAHLLDTKKENIVSLRTSTPLNHFTAGDALPIEYEYTVEPFLTEIILNNGTIRELQGIYFIIRDSINGEIQIGSSKTRGFGEIKFEIEDFIIEKYYGKPEFLDEKFFMKNEKISQKVGEKYLKEVFCLKPEYKKVDIENTNEFLNTIFSEVK